MPDDNRRSSEDAAHKRRWHTFEVVFGRATTRLVTTGVFSISRNPLYLGGVCVLIGIALALHLPWALLLLLPSLVAAHYILMVPEERYLARKFGAEYSRYADSVHRWFGRARRS